MYAAIDGTERTRPSVGDDMSRRVILDECPKIGHYFNPSIDIRSIPNPPEDSFGGAGFGFGSGFTSITTGSGSGSGTGPPTNTSS